MNGGREEVMKKYFLKPGEKGTDALQIQEMTLPDLGDHEVCVRVHSASVNYRDLLVANMGVSQALVPLSDGAGVVEGIGKAVISLKKGDRVAGLFFPLWQSGSIDAFKYATARGGKPTDGMLAQYVCGHEDGFIKFPDYLSFNEAATLPCAGLTAWNALVVQGKLKPGETIVILGTGGVALFGLQLAKSIGARVILLSSSDEKLEKGKAMGADALINYKKDPDWEKSVLQKTEQAGADLVLELGGGGTLARSIEAVKMSGRISLVGVLTGFDAQINPLPILRKSLTINGIYVGSRDMQNQFHQALDVNKIHPVIDRVFKFDQAKEAYAYMQSGRHFGKIVIHLES
jgi:NADPH:quinone reductase-like Zn-dependent oxidoreductase